MVCFAGLSVFTVATRHSTPADRGDIVLCQTGSFKQLYTYVNKLQVYTLTNSRTAMAENIGTPPILQGPTAKEKKYDRQLRLWAASGQAALENAKVLLLQSGSGVVGVETLKNLILPGVGSFTIVDETNVSELDLGVNFFLEESSLGRWRAEETCKFLQELNPEVKINALKEVRLSAFNMELQLC